jgi:hypothetical protein
MWNSASPKLINAMIAEHIYGWKELEETGPHKCMCGRSPENNFFVPIPDYLNDSYAPTLAHAAEVVEHMGYDISWSVQETGENFSAQLVIKNYGKHAYGYHRRVIDVWGESISEVCSFLAIYIALELS